MTEAVIKVNHNVRFPVHAMFQKEQYEQVVLFLSQNSGSQLNDWVALLLAGNHMREGLRTADGIAVKALQIWG